MQERMKMAKKTSCLVFAVAFLFSSLLSQERSEKDKQVQLHHEIVVTATRIETPAQEIASSVTVITGEELERMKKATVLEVLGEILGLVIVQNGPAGGSGSVLIRGANSEHTLILMDGVELNDPISPARSSDLAHITLENIDRIEILRGPQSTLYGSDAMSGIVNIITKKGQGDLKFSLSSAGGSYGTLINRAGLDGSFEKMHYSLGVSHFQSDGLSAASSDYEGNEEKDGYRNFSLSGRIGYRFNSTLELDFIVRILDARIDVDNFGGAYGDDPNNTQTNNSFFIKGQFRALLLNNRWEHRMSISLVDYDRKHENRTDSAHPLDSEQGLFKSRILNVDLQNNIFLHKTNTLTFGIDHQQEQGESEYSSDGIWGPSSSVFSQQRVRTTGFYIQDQVRLAQRFFASAGVRVDSHTQFGTSTTFRFAPAYVIRGTQTKLKATLGTGFKSPSIYQLYAPATFLGPIGNEHLNPERSTGWDIGIEQYFLGEKILFSATYFNNSYTDLIQFDFAQGYTNVGKAESKGLELSAQAILGTNFRLSASYTRTEAKDLVADTDLVRRPKDKFSASLLYPFLKRGRITLSLMHVGERKDLDFSTWPATRVTLDDYTLLNTVISYDITQHVQAFLRMDNILNEQYEMIKGYGTPGFSAYGGINLNF